MALSMVTGGTRSGKSEVAEGLVAQGGLPVIYVATGARSDAEMAERIDRHRSRRPAEWETLETRDPVRAFERATGRALLLDSLGGWLAALMEEHGLLTDELVEPLGDRGGQGRAAVLDRVAGFAARAAARPEPTVVVAEEAGLGLVPQSAAGRRFVDLLGEASQVIAASASRVELVVAGRSLELAPRRRIEPPGDLRFHGDELGRQASEDHAVSVVADGRPDWLEEALAAGVRAASRYPDERPAREAIARRHGRAPEEVVLTNGANEAFWLLAAALRPQRAVCVHPAYTEPEAALRANGVAVERAFRGPDFGLDVAAVPPGADLVVIDNPNNPSGALLPAAELAALARPGRTLVVDEAFMDLVPGEPESLAARAEIAGLVVVRSLTKLWSLPGIRAGYLLAPVGIAEAIERVQPSWNVNGVALGAIEACAPRAAEGRRRAERVRIARRRLEAGLARLAGIETWPSVANFILARTQNAERLGTRLLERGIAVRPCASFPGLGASHFRLAVRSEDANDRLLAALREAIR
jgi:histidinol-phosphate/aromatic aminotransferase/cobyric acid decarboxylase-like protein/adenosyl cobinamide kinase/adenosyl cobinamide phosphate guanylyltransferase